MAQIIVDGGSWWSPTGPLLKAGIHVSSDPELLQAAVDADLDWLRVVPDVDPLAAELSPTKGANLVLEAKPADESGPLTLKDLKTPDLLCGVCVADGTRTKPFANVAALHSHRRAKHPNLDPATGEVRDGTHMPGVPSVQTTVDETAARQGVDADAKAAIAAQPEQPNVSDPEEQQ